MNGENSAPVHFGDGADKGITVDPATGSVTIKLKHTLRVTGEDFSHITLRRPRGRDLDKMDKQSGTWGILLYMIDTLSDTDVPRLSAEMDVEDINRAALVVADFFGGSLGTGATL